MLLAGGEGSRLTVLSEQRAKPAVPFAGKFRIIDFTLSNCVHSGIGTVGVLTQYRPHSLNEHIGIGKPWGLDRSRGGVRLLPPYHGRGHQRWFAGTADAIYQNLGFISDHRADSVLILSGDHIYKMDYREMIRAHEELEHVTLERELGRYKRHTDQKWAELVYDGLWYSSLKGALDTFTAHTQEHVTGEIRLELHAGSINVNGRRSEESLYDFNLATYDEGDTFDQSSAKGFVQLHGLSSKIAKKRDMGL